MLRYYLFKICQFFADILPEKVSRSLARFVFDVHFYFSKKDKEAVKNNLRSVLSTSADLSKAAKEVFRNFGIYIIEFLRMNRMVNVDFIRDNVRVDNIENVQNVLDKGRGGIILTAHLGNWELGASVMSVLGYPLTAVALPHKEESVNYFFNRKRNDEGTEIISTKEAIKGCIKALRKNKLIAIVGDRDFSLQGEVLDFLGKKAIFPKGAAVFAQKTGAAIIPTFLTRDENKEGSYVLSVEDPIYADDTDTGGSTEKERTLDLMRKYISVIENKIRKYPTQWLIFRKFWA